MANIEPDPKQSDLKVDPFGFFRDREWIIVTFILVVIFGVTILAILT